MARHENTWSPEDGTKCDFLFPLKQTTVRHRQFIETKWHEGPSPPDAAFHSLCFLSSSFSPRFTSPPSFLVL